MTLKKELAGYWTKVDEAIGRIVQSGILPVGDESKGTLLTVEGLKDQIAKLKNAEYTIAVCGGVKAGKSTLLNSLIFGDSVLPVFDTPMTAKLTFIRHAQGNPRFEVEFYDREEWAEIEEEYQGEKRHELGRRLEKCAEKGIAKGAFISSPRRENHVGKDLKDLPEYISDVMSGLGKYTPFVKSVAIYIDHPSLENLQIVDTPGLNDSNTINSAETTKWVREAHAVIYVLEARGASQPDVEFFKTYFPSTAVKSRLFVQNKIDTDTGYESAKAAIRQYGMLEQYKALGLFGTEETICSYSGLAVLIQKKMQHGKELLPGEKHAVEKRALDLYPGDPDGLEGKLAETLFSGEGAARIETASGWLMQVYAAALAACEQNIASCENQLPDCERSEAELAAEIDKYEKYKCKLEQIAENAKEEFDNELQKKIGQIKDQLAEAGKVILDKVLKAAEDCGGTDIAVRGRIPYVLSTAKRQAFRGVRTTARDVKKDLRRRLLEIRDSLNDGASEIGIMDRIVVSDVSLGIEDRLEEAMRGIEVNGDSLYDKLPGRLKKVFTLRSKEDCAAIVLEEVRPAVEENILDCQNTLENMFTEAFDTEFKRILGGFKEHCKERSWELESARANLAGAKERREELKQKLKAAQDLKENLESSEREMKHFLGRSA